LGTWLGVAQGQAQEGQDPDQEYLCPLMVNVPLAPARVFALVAS
jgi:hypothetical protein